jgi:hypothetical protein
MCIIHDREVLNVKKTSDFRGLWKDFAAEVLPLTSDREVPVHRVPMIRRLNSVLTGKCAFSDWEVPNDVTGKCLRVCYWPSMRSIL